MEQFDLILLAAGRGTRTGFDLPKQFLILGDRPVLVHAAAVYAEMPQIGQKLITVDADQQDRMSGILKEFGLTDFQLVAGGKTRQDSVRRALARVQTRRVITHNAAVPFVTRELVENVIEQDFPCVTTVTPFPYSVCRGDEFAREAVASDDLKLINSPQSFHTEVFRQCHALALADNVALRSDCELMLHYGHVVRFVEGIPENFKITTALDVTLARTIEAERRLRG